MLWIGIDVGGTFTDAVAYDDDTGSIVYAKSPSTPSDPTIGVLNALVDLKVDLNKLERLVHGVTIGTNAVLEGKGADVWMLVTKGFKDVLEIGRTNRPVLYDIRSQKTPPLVPRTRSLEIDERLLFDGSVQRPLDAQDVRRATEALPREGDVAVAVCFLHSYVNGAHETAAREIVEAERPGVFVCASAEVLPQLREYERFNTAALNAYIGPLMGRYLSQLLERLRARGFQRELYIMTSNGGVATARRASKLPISTVLSGPAGGVAAAVHIGGLLGIPNLITCDMGGTSTDVCLIEDLKIPVTNEQKISDYANRMPQIEINAVGAGGGSIGWIDAGDVLMVGPQSAGASPGPACYGRGGTAPTITDANLVLNRLSGGSPLAGGQISLDRTLALKALETVGHSIGLDPVRLADGMVQIAVARMVSAIKQISISKGHDPRDFTLLPYGGAGPMHAAAIADELDIPRILVPVGPGNFAAFGSLISDLKNDYVQTRTLLLNATPWSEIDHAFREIEAEARRVFLAEGLSDDRIETRRAAGMRYLGQSWELNIDLPPDANSTDDAIKAFSEVHDRRFGHRSGGEVQIVTLRVTAIGRVDKPTLRRRSEGAAPPLGTAPSREVYFNGAFRTCPVYQREALPQDARLSGPAIIEESGSTTVLPPNWTARLLDHGELLLERI